MSKGEAEADSRGNRDPTTQVHMTNSTMPLKTESDHEKSCLENVPTHKHPKSDKLEQTLARQSCRQTDKLTFKTM